MPRVLILCLCLSLTLLGGHAEGAEQDKAHPEVPAWQLSAVRPVVGDGVAHVVGTGTPESVTAAALQHALESGGYITFDTGGKAVTIPVDATLNLPQGTPPTVLDGLGLVTLDGRGKVRILQKQWKTELTVQRTRFINALGSDSGGAINTAGWDGRLSIIDCVFEACKTSKMGPDIGGGAVFAGGQRRFLLSGCSFTGCSASNGGAVGCLGCEVDFVNCSFIGNHAFGIGGGAEVGPSGQGGIGGAYYMDGCHQNAEQRHAYISACLFQDNIANDHGGVVFNFTYAGSGSVVAYYACIFANNQVSTMAGQHMGWPGGVFVMDAQTIFSACTFVGNSSPKGPAALFLPTKEAVSILNCEFSGNLAGGGVESPSFPGATVENLMQTTSDTPVAVLALKGRWPGVPQPAKSTSKPTKPKPAVVATAKPAPAAQPAPVLADHGALAAWESRLLSCVHESLGSGRSPKFHSERMHMDILVNAMDADGTIHGTMNDGDLLLSWQQLSDGDRLSLAADTAKDTPLDQATLAFYLLLNGQRADVAKHLQLAPEYAHAVLTAFGIADLATLARN
jgi:hypothetical protein